VASIRYIIINDTLWYSKNKNKEGAGKGLQVDWIQSKPWFYHLLVTSLLISLSFIQKNWSCLYLPWRIIIKLKNNYIKKKNNNYSRHLIAILILILQNKFWSHLLRKSFFTPRPLFLIHVVYFASFQHSVGTLAIVVLLLQFMYPTFLLVCKFFEGRDRI
jgi:hypothetical protein